MVRVLVDAGATHASGAAAAVILERGGTIAEARRVLVVADPPVAFDPALLLDTVIRNLEGATA